MNNQFGTNQFGMGAYTGFNQPLTGKTVNDTLNNIDTWQQETKKKYDTQKTEQLETQGKTMYECAMRTSDGQVRKQNLSGANLSNMEIIIKQAAQDHGSNAYDELGDGQILCKFLNDNPQYEKISNGTLGGEVNLKTWARYIGANMSTPQTITHQQIYPNKQDDSNTGTNIAQGVLDTIMGPGKFISKQIDKGAAWIAKQFSDNDEAIDQQLQANLDYMPTLPGADRESTAYQAANTTSDIGATIATSFVPLVGWTKVPKLMQMATKYPKLMSILRLGAEGVKDTVVYNAANAEGTTPEEAITGAGTNVAFGGIFKGAEKVLGKLGIKGLLNGSRAEDVVEAIQKDGGKIGTVDDLTEWFNSRGFNGNKDEIRQQLKNRKTDAGEVKKELLSSIDKTYKSESTKEVLKALEKEYKGQPGLKEEYDEIVKLLNKGEYTPAEIERARVIMEDSPMNPFRAEGIGKPKGTAEDISMANLYNDIKTQLEKIAKEEGLGDLSKINNEIMVADKLEKGIKKKSFAEEVKDSLKGVTIPAAILGYFQEGDLLGALKYGGAVATGKMLSNTAIRTYISNAVRSISGKEKTNLLKWVNSGGKEVLSQSESKIIGKILQNADKETKKEIWATIIRGMGEGLRVGGVVGGVELEQKISGE